MSDRGEMHRISEVVKDSEDERLMLLTGESEWKNVVENVTEEILNDPRWLLSTDVFNTKQVEFNRKLLSGIKLNGLKSLDDVHLLSEDHKTSFAFVMCFMERFSITYDFPYVWRGGSLENMDNGLYGSFTFFVGSAKDLVEKSNFEKKKRKDPCLIAVPVSSIIQEYKKHWQVKVVLAEHAYDGIFNSSFELNIHTKVPDGTMVYFPG